MEYQYYEWLAIDRPLTEEELTEVNGLSSHIDVTPAHAVVTYNWSGFKHDPHKVLGRYFDAFLYYANWGHQSLAFRIPAKVLDVAQIEPYLWEDEVRLEASGEHLILRIAPEDEGDGYEDIDYEASLVTLARLRDDILAGDYRALYLAWLIGATSWDDMEEEVEPPVPAGLQDLTAALSAMIRFFDLDRYLIQAAAQASPALTARPAVAAREALARLSPAERDDFLVRLAQGEPHLSLTLNRRLRELAGKQEPLTLSARRRTLGELQAAAGALRAEDERRAREAAEARRREEEAAAEARHRQLLDTLAKRQPAAWREVETLIEKKTGTVYDEAVTHLANLRELAVRDGRLPDFQARVAQLKDTYARRPALLERLRRVE